MKTKLYIKYIVSNMMILVLRLGWIFPLEKKTVLFFSFNGNQYSDSPKYMSEYLEREYPDYHLVWAFIEPDNYGFLKERNISVISINSLIFLRYFLTSKYIVTNNFVRSYLPVRKSQVLINTWHGYHPLKAVGFMQAEEEPYDKYFFKIQNKKYTAFLSGSDFICEYVYKKSFHYKGKIVKFGIPRNAILLEEHSAIKEKVCTFYNLDTDNGIILYAPTFRGTIGNTGFIPEDEQIDIDECIKCFENRFGKKYRFLFRAHHAMTEGLHGDNFINATEYPDMQELLCAADILITDYSSCMGDMALMKKPIFLFTPDLGKFISSRGFYWDIHTLPFPISESMSEFVRAISEFNDIDYKAGVENYLMRLGNYESSDSIEKNVVWMLNN